MTRAVDRASSETPELDERISRLLEEAAGALLAGQPFDPASLQNAHPELMPELGRRLRDLQVILEAQRAVTEDGGDAGDPAGEGDDIQRIAADLKDYQILNRIYRGGQGAVYRAIERNTGRAVAIKVLSGGPFATIRQRQRFLREIKLTARFQHPHIVTIYGSGMICDQPYYVMEYVGGTPITDYAIVEGLSAAQRVALFATVVRAVAHAHKRGIIHRDLKPSNILVDSDGTPHILDFGLAKALDSAEESEDLISMVGHVVGTLPYLSPEQALGADVLDTRSDVYALAVVLFELLTGEFPYDVEGDRRVVRENILNAPPRRLAECLDGSGDEGYPAPREIGPDLEAIIARALAKEPDRRYQSADDLVADLERYLRGEAVQAKADNSLYVLRKLLRRYRVHAILAATFAVLVTGSAVMVTRLWLTASAERDNAREAARLAHSTLQEVVNEVDTSIRPLAGGMAVRDRLLKGVEGRLAQLESVVRNDASMEDVRVALAEKRGDMAAAEGRYAAAGAFYAAASRENPQGNDSAESRQEEARRVLRLELKKAECANDPHPHLDAALRLALRLVESAPGDDEILYLMGTVRSARLKEATYAFRYAAAQDEADALQRLLESRGDAREDVLDKWLALEAVLEEKQSAIHYACGRGPAAFTAANRLVELAERLLQRQPYDIDRKVGSLNALIDLAEQQYQKQERQAGLAMIQRVEDIATELLGIEPGHAATKKSLHLAHDQLSHIYFLRQQPKHMVIHVDADLALSADLVAADPDARIWQELQCRSWLHEGRLAIMEDRFEDARRVMTQSVEAMEALHDRFPDNPRIRDQLADSHALLAWAERQLDQYEEALGHYLRGIDLQIGLAQEQPQVASFQYQASESLKRVAVLLLELRTPEADSEAECWLDLALAGVSDLEGQGLLVGREVSVNFLMRTLMMNYILIEERARDRAAALRQDTLSMHGSPR